MPLGRLRGQVHRFGELKPPPLVGDVSSRFILLRQRRRTSARAWEDLKFARSVYQQLGQGAVTDGNRS